jgi:uncharacterized protein YegL
MRANGKIQALNWAIHEATPHMRSTARGNPDAQMLVRALTFADIPEWHIAEPTPVEHFAWTDVAAQGATALGAALHVVAEQLRMPPMEPRALQPVLVLVSDGDPTDEWEAGLAAIERERWGQRSLRVAIAIGDDANRDVLERFMGDTAEFRPLQANNPEALVQMIRWVSTSVANSASQPKPRREPGPQPGLGIPPEFVPDTSAPTVWGSDDG